LSKSIKKTVAENNKLNLILKSYSN
jgi:hypothetical protein